MYIISQTPLDSFNYLLKKTQFLATRNVENKFSTVDRESIKALVK